jgi:hypothetical protein
MDLSHVTTYATSSKYMGYIIKIHWIVKAMTVLI